MPETPVDKHGNFRANERHVRPAPRPRKRDIDAIAKSEGPKSGAQGNLAWRVSAASGLHPPTNVS
jgi:hypothetical protein